MNSKVYIVSLNTAQSRKILNNFHKLSDVQGECFENFDLFNFWKHEKTNGKDRSLIMWDYENNVEDKLWMNLKVCNNLHENDQLKFALFNLPQGTGIEKYMLYQGVMGVFYRNDDIEMLLKGIKAILQGELWFSRKLLSEFVLEINNNGDQEDDDEIQDLTLTPREEEILLMIAAGYSNSDIAEYLCITASTVKTHVYNIFQKINVPNRLQAALWTVKNLSRKTLQ